MEAEFKGSKEVSFWECLSTGGGQGVAPTAMKSLGQAPRFSRKPSAALGTLQLCILDFSFSMTLWEHWDDHHHPTMKSWVNFGQLKDEEAKTDVEMEAGRILDISQKHKQKIDLPNHDSLAERKWNSALALL